MNACLYIRTLLLGVILLPVFTKGQNEYARPASFVPERGGISEREALSIISNVPLNEINIHAFRYFHRRFPSISGESWTKSADGYIVSFMENAIRHQAHFDKRGAFLYSLQYYAGKDISGDLVVSIKKKYPDYRIGVVTEITDGEKTFYLVKIENNSFVKTLSICDGKTEVLEEF
jgi:hypothetical protein